MAIAMDQTMVSTTTTIGFCIANKNTDPAPNCQRRQRLHLGTTPGAQLVGTIGTAPSCGMFQDLMWPMTKRLVTIESLADVCSPPKSVLHMRCTSHSPTANPIRFFSTRTPAAAANRRSSLSCKKLPNIRGFHKWIPKMIGL